MSKRTLAKSQPSKARPQNRNALKHGHRSAEFIGAMKSSKKLIQAFEKKLNEQ
jgi:hypothetical protein